MLRFVQESLMTPFLSRLFLVLLASASLACANSSGPPSDRDTSEAASETRDVATTDNATAQEEKGEEDTDTQAQQGPGRQPHRCLPKKAVGSAPAATRSLLCRLGSRPTDMRRTDHRMSDLNRVRVWPICCQCTLSALRASGQSIFGTARLYDCTTVGYSTTVLELQLYY